MDEICERPKLLTERIEVNTNPDDNPPGTWPWMGSLGYYSGVTGKWIHNCGACLITKQHAVTAAHCHLESLNE